MVLEKALESPLDCKEIKPVNPKGNQPDYSLEGLMLKLQYFWPPDATRQLVGKDLDVGKDRRQKEKGVAEDEMVRLYHWLSGH